MLYRAIVILMLTPFKSPTQLDPGYTTQALYAVLLSYVDEKTMAAVGHQPQDFIRSCAFDGIRCNYTYVDMVGIKHPGHSHPLIYKLLT